MKPILLSLVILMIWASTCAFLPEVPSHLVRSLSPPSLFHPLGFDALGRDMLWRIGDGLGLSLWVGAWASLVAMVIGTLYGSFAAMAGGKTDRAMMRAVEVINALPLVLFVVLVGLYVGKSLIALFAAIGAIEWTTLSRMVRARLLKVRSRDFVLAARTMGASNWEVLWRHLIPHTFGVVLAYTMLNLPAILILEATLSYLGLGVQPPQASLGVLLNEGAQAMTVYPWLLWGPAVVFVWLLSTVYALGEKLRKKIID